MWLDFLKIESIDQQYSNHDSRTELESGQEYYHQRLTITQNRWETQWTLD